MPESIPISPSSSSPSVMPVYKLHYFDGRGLAEVIRQLFHFGNTEFEDIRMGWQEWQETGKQTAPWGHLPWLEIDDTVLTQSWAIARYLAKQFGYAGKTPFECAQVDALADQFKDYWNEMSPFFYAMYLNDPEIAKQAKAVGKDMGNAKENFDKQKKEVGEKGRDKFYGILSKEYKKNGSTGYLVGSALTWIDLVVVDHMGVVDYFAPGFLDEFEEIRELQKKINAIPKLQEWLKKRKHTPQ